MTEPTAEPVAATPVRWARWLLPATGAVGFVVLAMAIVALWLRPVPIADLSETTARLEAIEARLARLEQRPSGPGFPDPEPRLQALEHRIAPDLTGVYARIGELERRPSGDAEQLAARFGVLEQNVNRRAHAQTAVLALAAGRPLGDIPNAPPILTRFANKAPPTEAALRLAFPAAERAVLEAGIPNDNEAPLWKRISVRLEDLFVLRQGDRVLIGDPAAGILIRARAALEAGDLAGAVAALSALQGAAAAAMAGWMADAQALVAVRAALADIAAAR